MILYRVLELIGQYRFFAKSVDTADVDAGVKGVAEALQALGPDRQPVRPDSAGRYQLGRQHAAWLLQELGDPLAGQLEAVTEGDVFPARARNASLLIHGFHAKTRGKESGSVYP